MNQDGIPDLTAASEGFLEVALGNGDGTFQPATLYVAGDSTGITGFILPAIAVGDLNGDGHPDIIVGDGGTNEWLSVLYGDGSGAFGSAVNYPSASAPFALGVADFNGDGRTGLVVTGGTSADAAGSVGVLLGSTPGPACSTVNPLSVATGGNGGPQVVDVTETSPSCQWVVSSPNTWFELTVIGDPGNGTIAALISPDASGSDQTGSFTVDGQTIAVTQRFTNQEFLDAPPAAYYFDAVNELSVQGITTGCGAGDFCPSENVTRDEMAVFMVRTVFNGSDNFTYPAQPYFTDVPASYWAFKWIQKLFELGITAIYSVSGYATHFVQGVTTIAPQPGVPVGPITVQGTSLYVRLTAAAVSIVAITGNPPGNEEVVLPNGLTVVAPLAP